MDSLISKMPESLDDDDPDEALRCSTILMVRGLIAKRWIAMRTIGSTWHAEQREVALSGTRECIQSLILLHGENFEFSPDADFYVPMPGVWN